MAPTGRILVELFIDDINLQTFEATEFNEMSPFSGCAGGLVVPKLMCKGKAVSLQAWSGPECSRRLRLPDFKTDGT